MVRFSGFRIRRSHKFYTKKYRTKKYNRKVRKYRSSRSQAQQIINLNKKINRVYKKTRPDINNFYRGGSKTLDANTQKLELFNITPALIRGVFPDIRVDSDIKLYNMNFRYTIKTVPSTDIKIYRIVIIQLKNGNNNASIDISDYMNLGGLYTQSYFKDNVTNEIRILYDKNIYITPNYPLKQFKYSINPRDINYKVTMDEGGGRSPSYTNKAGSIYAFMLTDTPAIGGTFYYKYKMGVSN